jgi:hypothetical protein
MPFSEAKRRAKGLANIRPAIPTVVGTDLLIVCCDEVNGLAEGVGAADGGLGFDSGLGFVLIG